jgi:hypothetical protein
MKNIFKYYEKPTRPENKSIDIISILMISVIQQVPIDFDFVKSYADGVGNNEDHDNDKCSDDEKDEFDAPNKVIVQNHKDYRIEVDCERRGRY